MIGFKYLYNIQIFVACRQNNTFSYRISYICVATSTICNKIERIFLQLDVFNQTTIFLRSHCSRSTSFSMFRYPIKVLTRAEKPTEMKQQNDKMYEECIQRTRIYIKKIQSVTETSIKPSNR